MKNGRDRTASLTYTARCHRTGLEPQHTAGLESAKQRRTAQTRRTADLLAEYSIAAQLAGLQ